MLMISPAAPTSIPSLLVMLILALLSTTVATSTRTAPLCVTMGGLTVTHTLTNWPSQANDFATTIVSVSLPHCYPC